MKYLKEKAYKTSPHWLNALAVFLVPLITLITMEWIHRGSLDMEFAQKYLGPNFISYVLAYLFLLVIYSFIVHLSGLHWLAALLTGIVGIAPATVTYFKLQMRGEPFLPWDLMQLGDFLGVAESVKLVMPPAVIITVLLFVCIVIGLAFVHLPYSRYACAKSRLIGSLASLVAAVGLGLVYLSPSITLSLGIYPDMWMQDRYYKYYGVISGFMTNLQTLKIERPRSYSEQTLLELEAATKAAAKTREPLYAASLTDTEVKQPNIIYVMNESFWDVTRLDGIEYSEPITPTLDKLAQEGAYGMVYSPSFGGGTCDVEFEALTGFSVEHLPSGAKPYQQHVTHDMFSLPQYLKAQGYSTQAIHGYHRKFWSRDTAYPRLGIDRFIAFDNFVNPQTKRGFISDMEMTRRIITEYESRTDKSPMFIHAVTMQNHTTYDESHYPEDELVNITKYPQGLSQETLGQLRDFATGVREADEALGTLVEYFAKVDEPTIIVFWGDHFNPVGEGYELYENTGFTMPGAAFQSPNLHETDLRIWSNYHTAAVDIGTIASYNISPVMMDLYGLDMPVMFEFLAQQLPFMRARTRGNTVEPDGSFSEDMTQQQLQIFENHAVLQYDFMFGEGYLEDYTKK